MISRRQFLAGIGGSVAASSASSTLLARGAAAQTVRPQRFVLDEDRFGRMFPDLDPFFRDNSPRLQAALKDIGKLGGILDARDELGNGGKQAAIALIVDPALSARNPNNPALQLDRNSYLWRRGWRPTLPERGGRETGEFTMVDFLTFAGVAPDQRGQ